MAPFVLLRSFVIARVCGAALLGIEPFAVTVEADVERGLPKFDVVGLAQGAVQEGRNRIVSALRNSGVVWNAKRITVNLAPAAIRKEGANLDLPIAIALAAALGVVQQKRVEDILFVGEVALDGVLRPVRGAWAYAEYAIRQGRSKLVLPYPSASEIPDGEKIQILGPVSLSELLSHLRGEQDLPAVEAKPVPLQADLESIDWSDVGGQEVGKRALEIAAAGDHNLLFVGPPGVGKTLLARRLPTILPPPNAAALKEILRIHSIAGSTGQGRTLRIPPFRNPHHTASYAGMTGGGKTLQPGEFTLAHHGVLFLDEFPEFRRDVIEALRGPLEHGKISISRVENHYEFPARFLLLGAMNLCPCGALGDPRKNCICTPPAIDRYQGKVSGPIRDRLDLTVSLLPPTWEDLWKGRKGETSQDVRARVTAARAYQAERGSGVEFNGRLDAKQIKAWAWPDGEGEKLLSKAVDRLALSGRGIHKTLRVARTIADLSEDRQVSARHVAEALQYRLSTSRAF